MFTVLRFFLNFSQMKVKPTKKEHTIKYKGKTLKVIQETENYYLVSEYHQGFKMYSVTKRDLENENLENGNQEN